MVKILAPRLPVGEVPGPQIAKGTQPEIRRLIVLGEIHPDTRIAELLVGQLKRIAVVPRNRGRIQTQPERSGTSKLARGIRDVPLGAVRQHVATIRGEFQRRAKLASTLDQCHGRVAESGRQPDDVLTVLDVGAIDPTVARSKCGIWPIVESGMKRQGAGEGIDHRGWLVRHSRSVPSGCSPVVEAGAQDVSPRMARALQ